MARAGFPSTETKITTGAIERIGMRNNKVLFTLLGCCHVFTAEESTEMLALSKSGDAVNFVCDEFRVVKPGTFNNMALKRFTNL